METRGIQRGTVMVMKKESGKMKRTFHLQQTPAYDTFSFRSRVFWWESILWVRITASNKQGKKKKFKKITLFIWQADDLANLIFPWLWKNAKSLHQEFLFPSKVEHFVVRPDTVKPL